MSRSFAIFRMCLSVFFFCSLFVFSGETTADEQSLVTIVKTGEIQSEKDGCLVPVTVVLVNMSTNSYVAVSKRPMLSWRWKKFPDQKLPSTRSGREGGEFVSPPVRTWFMLQPRQTSMKSLYEDIKRQRQKNLSDYLLTTVFVASYDFVVQIKGYTSEEVRHGVFEFRLAVGTLRGQYDIMTLDSKAVPHGTTGFESVNGR